MKEKENISKIYLTNIRKLFRQYKELGEKSIAQVNNEQIHWCYDENSNSIAIVVKHLSGNMLSRWTDFLNSDGEKEWRNRDTEFENDNLTPSLSKGEGVKNPAGIIRNKKDLMKIWKKGWNCLFFTIDSLSENDLQKKVFIRKETLTVVDAINRQVAHYAYHIGQIVYIAKMINSANWKSLSIPKGKSEEFMAVPKIKFFHRKDAKARRKKI